MKRTTSVILLATLIVLPQLIAVAAGPRQRPTFTPQIPRADRSTGNRVFLEHADVLTKKETDSFMVLDGNVVFTKGAMIMKCDSAHYYPSTESMDAFGHVSMEQGDTLFVYADELNYIGDEEIAYLYANPGKKVRMINRDVELRTDEFVYDIRSDLGYYQVGGVLTDPSNVLTSLQGEYVPSTKEANFYIDVHLHSFSKDDTLDIYTDTLYYNTGSRIAVLNSPGEIINSRGTIYTSNGTYDTAADTAILFDRSLIVTSEGNTLTADTIYYDHAAGIGRAWGAALITDSVKQVDLAGDYGFYDQQVDSSFVTGRAELREYSGADTLYLHGTYVQSTRLLDSVAVPADTIAGTEAFTRIDTTHVAVIWPRVRFYRRDMQGLCDSMRFTSADSTLRMYFNPIIWNEDQQVFGEFIELQFNDSTIHQARIPKNAFTASHIEGEHYNQMSGKSMIADFEDGEMRHLYVDGNVELIIYPEESDSTINKLVQANSSFLEAWFRGQTTERIKMWPETNGTVTPMFLARRSMFYLPKFKWYEVMRPMNRDDIFIVPEEMEELMRGIGR